MLAVVGPSAVVYRSVADVAPSTSAAPRCLPFKRPRAGVGAILCTVTGEACEG